MAENVLPGEVETSAAGGRLVARTLRRGGNTLLGWVVGRTYQLNPRACFCARLLFLLRE